jgi:hypothetical protein
MRKIYVVLHGGLGNQLFQYFMGLILLKGQENNSMNLATEYLDGYSAKREYELAEYQLDNVDHKLIKCKNVLIKLRIPKLLKKFRITKEFILNIPLCGVVIDGYFQNKKNYMKCHADHVRQTLQELRKRWHGNNVTKKYGIILHLRLTDFFGQEDDAISFVKSKLTSITYPVDLITDQEELVIDVIKTLRKNDQIQLIDSKKMKATEVLKILASYEKIITNGSTLAFWASILNGSELETSNQEHTILWRYLNEL